jgi:DNA-binding NtrC family response regulator
MKILVVEDEICQQEWLTRNLSDAGHEVTTACDGDWALTLWMSQRPFEVVVTDNLFGGKTVRNGQHLIELIQAIDPGQPFIMQAGSASVELPRGIPFLHKPYPIRRLLRLIASAKQQRLPLFPLNSASR